MVRKIYEGYDYIDPDNLYTLIIYTPIPIHLFS